MQISTETFIIFSLLFLLFLPYFHLIFIFLVMNISEWLDKLCKKISNLVLAIYDFIICIISNPIILLLIVLELLSIMKVFT